MKRIPLALCGLGTVGSGVVRLLQSHEGLIADRLGVRPQLVQVGARRPNPACDLGPIERVEDVFAPAEHKEARILIEVLGGTDTAYELTSRAFKAGKNVITANKALIAERGDELMELAYECGVSYAYEGAVAGGIPIVKVLREGLAANRIRRISGIINGTTNFILSCMAERKLSFPAALERARESGYAEADPSFDINGTDSAHKLKILSALAFDVSLAQMAPSQEGIADISPEDLQYADELGYVVKHLAIAERFSDGRLNLRVHPALVHKEKALAQVSGPGAGGDATASAIVADLMDMVRCPNGFGPSFYHRLERANYVPLESIESEFYVCVNVRDETGVMAKLTRILSKEDISIEALHQKEQEERKPQTVPVIIITHKTMEKRLNRAIECMQGLDQVMERITRLRVFNSPS